MNLIKLLYPTPKEWPAIEQRGAASYHIRITLSYFLIILSLLSAFYLYGLLLSQVSYFAYSSTSLPFVNAVSYNGILYLIGVIIGGIIVSDSRWFKYKWFDKNGDASWPANKKAGRTSKWLNRHGLAFWVFYGVFIGSLYCRRYINDISLATNTVDIIMIVFTFITPGILLGAVVAKKIAEIDARKFNFEEKKITVWPYSIPFLITLCILIAAALGHPI